LVGEIFNADFLLKWVYGLAVEYYTGIIKWEGKRRGEKDKSQKVGWLFFVVKSKLQKGSFIHGHVFPTIPIFFPFFVFIH
jgi:hypothetical protein